VICHDLYPSGGQLELTNLGHIIGVYDLDLTYCDMLVGLGIGVRLHERGVNGSPALSISTRFVPPTEPLKVKQSQCYNGNY
jgi:hypothetical protein